MGCGRWPADEVEAQLPGPAAIRAGICAVDGLEPVAAAAGQAAGRAAAGRLQHRHPGVLVGHVARQIDLVRRLHIEERFGLVLHARSA